MNDFISQQAFKLLQELMAQGFDNVTTSIDDLKATVNAELARGTRRMDDLAKRNDEVAARVTLLEAWRAGVEGERRGVAFSAKLIWGFIGGGVTAVAVALLKLAGVM